MNMGAKSWPLATAASTVSAAAITIGVHLGMRWPMPPPRTWVELAWGLNVRRWCSPLCSSTARLRVRLGC